MKAVFITSTHEPDDPRIFYKESRTLVEAGWDVTILAMSNKKCDQQFGVKLAIVPKPKNRYARVISARRLKKIALDLDADVYVICDAEIVSVGRWLARNGKKFFYDALEPYPDFIAEKDWVLKPFKPLVKKLVANEELRGARASSGIIVAMRENAERLKTAKKPTLTLHNFPRIQDAEQELPVKEDSIVYSGIIMPVRFGAEMLMLGEHTKKGGALEGWKMEILGSVHGEEYLKKCMGIAEQYKENIFFPGKFVPYKEAMERMKRAKFGLSLIQPTKKYDQCISGKIFDYMAKGTIPIATWLSAYDGIVSEADGPVFISPGSEKKIANIIAELVRDENALKQRAQRCIESVRNKFNWEKEAKDLVKFLEHPDNL